MVTLLFWNKKKSYKRMTVYLPTFCNNKVQTNANCLTIKNSKKVGKLRSVCIKSVKSKKLKESFIKNNK